MQERKKKEKITDKKTIRDLTTEEEEDGADMEEGNQETMKRETIIIREEEEDLDPEEEEDLEEDLEDNEETVGRILLPLLRRK